jgi:hypothetical protein
MATRVFRANPGEGEYTAPGSTGVTDAVGAATTKLVELTVDCGATAVGGVRPITREEVMEAIEEISNYIMRGPWPPA